jgi:hypothetical protein
VTPQDSKGKRMLTTTSHHKARQFLQKATGLSKFATDQQAQDHFSGLHPELQDACMSFAQSDDDSDDESQEDAERRKAKGRRFLTSATGFDPSGSDADAQAHLDSLSPELQKACMAFAESDDDDDDEHDDIGRHAVRTVYAASGPGVQADDSAPGQLSTPFGHMHQARIINLPTQYDQITGPEILEPGVRVTFAMHPQTLDKQPIAVQFDSDKFTEDQARAWLAARNIREYTFQPDNRDQTPVTQGNPRDEGETPPQGFSDLNSFYSATIPVEVDEAVGRYAAATAGDVLRSYSSFRCPQCKGGIMDEVHSCPSCGTEWNAYAEQNLRY